MAKRDEFEIRCLRCRRFPAEVCPSRSNIVVGPIDKLGGPRGAHRAGKDLPISPDNLTCKARQETSASSTDRRGRVAGNAILFLDGGHARDTATSPKRELGAG